MPIFNHWGIILQLFTIIFIYWYLLSIIFKILYLSYNILLLLSCFQRFYVAGGLKLWKFSLEGKELLFQVDVLNDNH